MGKHQTCVAAATTTAQRRRRDADVNSGFVVIAALLTILRTHTHRRPRALVWVCLSVCVCERMFCLYEWAASTARRLTGRQDLTNCSIVKPWVMCVCVSVPKCWLIFLVFDPFCCGFPVHIHNVFICMIRESYIHTYIFTDLDQYLLCVLM